MYVYLSAKQKGDRPTPIHGAYFRSLSEDEDLCAPSPSLFEQMANPQKIDRYYRRCGVVRYAVMKTGYRTAFVELDLCGARHYHVTLDQRQGVEDHTAAARTASAFLLATQLRDWGRARSLLSRGALVAIEEGQPGQQRNERRRELAGLDRDPPLNPSALRRRLSATSGDEARVRVMAEFVDGCTQRFDVDLHRHDAGWLVHDVRRLP